jgi:hypothetical protein
MKIRLLLGLAGLAIGYTAPACAQEKDTVDPKRELAAEDSAIKVNSADPGYTATDLNQHRGTRTVEEGARAAVRLATLHADGPSGGFFNEEGPVPW